MRERALRTPTTGVSRSLVSGRIIAVDALLAETSPVEQT